MTFTKKVDESTLEIDLSVTKIADVLQYCKPKEQFVLIKKFGLSNNKEIPLQQIGNEFGMTRERIRQIENQGLMRFRRLVVNNDKYLNIIQIAKDVLDQNGWLLSWSKLISKLIDKKISDLSPQELKVVLLSDFDIVSLTRNKYLEKCFYLDPIYETALTDMAKYIQDHFAKHSNKEQDMYNFIDQVKSIYESKYPNIIYFSNSQFYTNLFEVIRDISIFDGKIWSSKCPVVNPKTIKAKILYVFSVVNKPLHYNEVANKVMEYFPNKVIKISTVHNEMVKSRDEFVNIWLGIYVPKTRWYLGWQVKDILIRVIKKAGRPMAIKELTQHVLKEKMVSPNTISLNLHKHKDLFLKNSEGQYYLAKK